MLQRIRYVLVLLFTISALRANDVLLEFKAAAFLPTNSCVQSIYGNVAALFGPEVTFQLCDGKGWYGFASVDFLHKKGHSIGLCECTTLSLIPIGLGIKYFVPFDYGDFYVGLGIQPTRCKTVNCTTDAVITTTGWGVGGVTKIGTYIDLPRNWFLDFFFDYSFVKVKSECCIEGVQSLNATLNGAIFGAGVGYRFY